MLLVFDIGNTNVVVGAFEAEKLLASWRLSTVRERTADEVAVVLAQLFQMRDLSHESVTAAIISSVVPPILPVYIDMCRIHFGITPLVVGPGIKTGMQVLYENPREVGADRIVNAVAAIDKYEAPLIIVDFGTATTFCSITPGGQYQGGVIAPGIGISAEALFRNAAKLPRVEITAPPTVIGRNTVNSMQSGLVYGYVGLVDGILERMMAEVDWEPSVVATGGFSELIGSQSRLIQKIEPNLTLYGLRLLYEKNVNHGKNSET